MLMQNATAFAGTSTPDLVDRVRSVLATAVGCPKQTSLDLDADLGIDLGLGSIISSVVWTALRREFDFGDDEVSDMQRASEDLRTLRGIGAAIYSTLVNRQKVRIEPLPDAGKDPARLASAEMFEEIARVVADVTRYPLDILERDARIEDDLGIDSVKWGAVALALVERLGAPPAWNWPSEGFKTLGAVADFIAASRPLPPIVTIPSAAAPNFSTSMQPHPVHDPARFTEVATVAAAPVRKPEDHETRVPAAALTGNLYDYRVSGGSDLLERGDAFYAWQELRRKNRLWSYSRVTTSGPGTACSADDDAGRSVGGVNFASQDYLSLASHPEIKAAATEAIARFGVHSAGSSAFLGNTPMSIALERKIAEFLSMEETVLYPTGWAAGYGVIRGLVRPNDYILIDRLSHSCLREGAGAATQNVSVFRHLDVEHCRTFLRSIRARDTQNGILVVTEGLFSMNSDSPDIGRFQDLCREYGAILLVDVAHDLGCLGEDGRGYLGIQNMIGKVDLVMGSFSKTFASNGGFVATNKRSIKEYLRYYSPSTTFSNALSPAQAATVLKAFEIIDSPQGASLRSALMNNILQLRRLLTAQNLHVFGDPSAIVAVKVDDESVPSLISRRLSDLGLLTNLVEYPAVEKGTERFRLQVMANHAEWEIRHAARCMQLATNSLENQSSRMATN